MEALLNINMIPIFIMIARKNNDWELLKEFMLKDTIKTRVDRFSSLCI